MRVQVLSINVADDRIEQRIGSQKLVLGILEAICQWAERAIDGGWVVHLTQQASLDVLLIEYARLRCNRATGKPHPNFKGVKLPAGRCKLQDAATVVLAMRTEQDVYAYYRGVTVAASMRGHGVMIPFGIHCATISLLSHDKVRALSYPLVPSRAFSCLLVPSNAWISLRSHDKVRAFVLDIGRPEWGVELQHSRRPPLLPDHGPSNATATQRAVTDELTRLLRHIDVNRGLVYSQIRHAQRALLGVTGGNLLLVARDMIQRSRELGLLTAAAAQR